MTEMLSLPASRTELVLERIRKAILTRELLPGQPLVEMELAQRLGVSKTPVREALKLLSGSGLVTFSPYKGASVSVVDEDLARQVYDVRLLLEPEAVRRTVSSGEPTCLTEAAEVLEAASGALAEGDHAELSLLNRRFHRALYAGCGNPLMVRILDDVRDRAALISVTGWEVTPSAKRELDEHRAVLRAAKAGKADRAAELLHKHIAAFLDRLVTALARQ
ncbi:GntR family transcriptional regulator [Amycolatopsis cynarae]|uniref:GntR family transcriptional regulator n=1 Tax=Amycolatopsis cynarae TaxID=2995223 RepID=A0ABY7B7T7_9PSEU|nr:GntR family transcriptional regulator [Amycolatopsis sp. HUAS 11-8]WAL68400.1 GntR family transcriptional regulator [Amycolatopsis sp. HUAS 11-8]